MAKVGTSSTPITARLHQLTLHKPPHFVTPLNDKYICTHCREALKEPVRQSECGHRFCSTCIQSLLDDKGVVSMCPANEDGCFRLTESSIHPDRGTEREMGKLLVYCHNYPKCLKTMELRQLAKHMQESDFCFISCIYSKNGCAVRLALKEKETHLKECKHRPRKCRFCYKEVPYMQITDHELECQEKTAFCDYKPEGCKFVGRRKDLLDHMNVEEADHLELVRKVIRDEQGTTRSLRQQVQQLTVKCNEQENNLAALNTDLTQLKELVDTGTLDMPKPMSRQTKQTPNLYEISNTLNNESQQVNSLLQNLGLREIETHRSGEYDLSKEENPGIRSQEQTTSLNETTLNEYETRLRGLQTPNNGSMDNGMLQWKITNYRIRKEAAILDHMPNLYSQPFYTHPYGYKMCACMYLNGDGREKGTHASLYLILMKGDYDAQLPWPFAQRVTMMIHGLENSQDHIQHIFRPDQTGASFQRPVNGVSNASGLFLVVPLSVLETEKYLRNDSVTIAIKIHIDQKLNDVHKDIAAHMMSGKALNALEQSNIQAEASGNRFCINGDPSLEVDGNETRNENDEVAHHIHEGELNCDMRHLASAASSERLASTTETEICCDGFFPWEIKNVSMYREMAKSSQLEPLRSPPFYTSRHGYRMCLNIYLNGCGAGKGTHISFFFAIMKGANDKFLPWPFKQKVELTLLDQQNNRNCVTDTFRPDPTSSSFKRPVTEMNIGVGSPFFLQQSLLDENQYVHEDTVCVLAKVDTNYYN